jgi:hypothetical protein
MFWAAKLQKICFITHFIEEKFLQFKLCLDNTTKM